MTLLTGAGLAGTGLTLGLAGPEVIPGVWVAWTLAEAGRGKSRGAWPSLASMGCTTGSPVGVAGTAAGSIGAGGKETAVFGAGECGLTSGSCGLVDLDAVAALDNF